jgi:hypothetical protein
VLNPKKRLTAKDALCHKFFEDFDGGEEILSNLVL